MKKVLSCLLVVLLLAGLSMTAFAAGSPTNAGGPVVVSQNDEDNTVSVITYENRDQLDDDAKAEIEEAYDSLQDADLTSLNDDLTAAAGDKEIAIGDIFYVDEESTGKEVTVESLNLDNFAALMFYNHGDWEIIKSAKVVDNKLTVTFPEAGVYATFNAVDNTTSAETGESVPYGYIAAAVVLLAAAAWFITKSRKVEE